MVCLLSLSLAYFLGAERYGSGLKFDRHSKQARHHRIVPIGYSCGDTPALLGLLAEIVGIFCCHKRLRKAGAGRARWLGSLTQL